MTARSFTRTLLCLPVVSAVAATAAFATTINQSISVTVPDVYDPTCITRNGETTCTPDAEASTVTVTAIITEAESVSISEGAPQSQQNGQSCGKLAKTVHVQLQVGGSVTVSRDGQVIGQPIVASVPSQDENIEICQN